MARSLLFLCLILLWLSPAISAQERFRKKAVTHLYVGSYAANTDDHHLKGSKLGLGLKYYYDPHWATFFFLSEGSAQETYSPENSTAQYDLYAHSYGFTGGLEWRTQLDREGNIEPFVGIGLNAENYELEFEYPGSEVGTTSGTGYGPLMELGGRFALGRSFTVIPAYEYSAISYKAGSGDSKTLVAAGFSLGLIFRF